MDALDSRFLREFLAVAQEGSIRRAADRLNVVPSAISRKIADAEVRLGVTLFERSSRGVTVTEAGELLRDRDEGGRVAGQRRAWCDGFHTA